MEGDKGDTPTPRRERGECEEEERFLRKYWAHFPRRFNNTFLNIANKCTIQHFGSTVQQHV